MDYQGSSTCVKIPENSLEYPPDFLSKPWTSAGSSIPLDVLQFDHSYGYNCKKFFNLCLIEPNTLVFGSGNLIHFLNVTTGQVTFRRSACGGGISCIIKNPNDAYNYLTVAENGSRPLVIIYKYPEMEVVSLLKDGAERSYTHLTYSPNGELLATQAGEPDYILTLWNWRTSSIILRAKAFQNDVVSVKFSSHDPMQLTTCGLGHIKFWKMNKTFTGLKLQGELGRFGKTEICDIFAAYPMADEKVISGCEWGNMLVWEGGLIKFEVCRKSRRPCHEAPITQIVMLNEDEIMTVGMDGFVRVWFWETVELSDPPEDDRFVEIDPVYECRIGDRNIPCKLMYLVKEVPNDEKHHSWFAQDAKGGIWACNLNPEGTPGPSKRIYDCHEGSIRAVSASSCSTHIATLDEGGNLHIYDYIQRTLVCKKFFPAGGRDALWLPTTVDPTGMVVVAGFDDGVIRVMAVNLKTGLINENSIILLDVSKPHTKPITKLTINPKESCFVSASEDKTIFIHSLKVDSPFLRWEPVGFVEFNSIPTALCWKSKRRSTIIVGTHIGQVFEFDVPDRPRDYTEASFNLAHIQMKSFKFKSVKSAIRRDLKIEEKRSRKEAKRLEKIENMKILRQTNPTVEIDEDVFLDDSEPEEEDTEPLYEPKPPNRILWLHVTHDDTVWISMAGYDAGYIYELSCTKDTFLTTRNTSIADADDNEIHSFIYTNNFLVFGMMDGKIRVNSLRKGFRDLTEYWILPMHDSIDGVVTGLCSSADGQFLFSVGSDGNIFSYKWKQFLGNTLSEYIPELPMIDEVSDIDDENFLSLEQQKIKIEFDRQNQTATERREIFFDILSEYRLQFKKIVERNRALPPSQQFGPEDFELDSRVTEDFIESLDKKLQLVRRKMAFDVEKARLGREKVMNFFINPLQDLQIEVFGLMSKNSVRSFRVKKLDEDFYDEKMMLDERIERRKQTKSWERRKSTRNGVIRLIADVETREIRTTLSEQKSFLEGICLEAESKLGFKMKRLLEKYRERKSREKERKLEWEAVNAEKPDPNENHEDDDRKIEDAKRAIGDYKLKSDPDYVADENETTLEKLRELLVAREELHEVRNSFNQKVFELRQKKTAFFSYLEKQKGILAKIHKLIPKELHLSVPNFAPMDESKEFPENVLKVFSKIDKIRVNATTGMEVKDLSIRKSEAMRKSFMRKLKVQENRYYQLISDTIGLVSDAKNVPFGRVCDLIDRNIRISEKSKGELKNLVESDGDSTSWEAEKRYLKIVENLFAQDQILLDIQNRFSEFDNELNELAESRLEAEITAKYLEAHILTLNQELAVFREFEKIEDACTNKIEACIIKRNEIQSEIIQIKGSIEARQKSIESHMEKQKSTYQEFLANIKGSKFHEFLLRVFKMKYKAATPINADESNESASADSKSSEEKEEEARLDENTYPPGLDQSTYNLTVDLRSIRHNLEQQVLEEQKRIVEANKQIHDLAGRMRTIEDELEIDNNRLVEYRREKQRILNKIEATVVLRMDQMQYLSNGQNLYDIEKTLLFEAENVTKLQTRVGQLAVETLDAKRRHKVNIIHLSRMKSDCQYMENVIQKLKSKIDDAMVRKFGMVVSLDELEESMLRKYVFNIKADLSAEKKNAEKEIQDRRDMLANLENELIRETQIGTEKLNILTVLQEEKNYHQEILNIQRKVTAKSASAKKINFRHDLKKLKEIEKQQQEQIEFLEREIRTLRLKSKPFLPIVPKELSSGAFREILPPHDERDYEESVYINVQHSSPRTAGAGRTPDIDLSDKIDTLCRKFLAKHIGKHADENMIRKYAARVSKYLAYIANNTDPNDSDEENVMSCVLENFQNLLPQKFLVHISNDDITSLFEQILTNFRFGEADVHISDVLHGIITNSLVAAEQLNSMNYTQDAITDMIKQMIDVLPIEDIDDSKTIEQIATSLSEVPLINVKCVNVQKLIDNILIYAKENLIEDIDLTFIKTFIDKFIAALTKKIGFDGPKKIDKTTQMQRN